MKRSKKGFTLAELLVVVAIIAVLVAIAIPVFTSSKDKAEEAVEVANARATYAEGMTKILDGSLAKGTEYAKTYGEKTYTFTYPATGESWSVAVSGGKVYHTPYTTFDGTGIDGTVA